MTVMFSIVVLTPLACSSNIISGWLDNEMVGSESVLLFYW